MLVRRSFSPSLSQAAFDRTFQQLVAGLGTPTFRGPAVHATREGGALTLTVDLPGVPAEAIDVEVAGRELTLQVDHEGSSWSRTMRLGPEYDLDAVRAEHVNGRLTVTVGPTPAAEVRKVAITTTPLATAAVGAGEAPTSDGEELTSTAPAGDSPAEAVEA